ncbi:hypothetical protein GGI07_003089 [Coemansia sp. Benny D115]|nr:hypothetical protein GGI07_003089 [Coemansia sp. Benny D115]
MYASSNPSTYAIPRVVPNGSELHTAFAEMPKTRRGIQFNPWLLLLELLDDPRLVVDPEHAGNLLRATGHLGWITPQNMATQRPLLAQYLLRSRFLKINPQLSLDHKKGGTQSKSGRVAREHSMYFELTPAQQTVLCQMQWPRFIAQKYTNALDKAAEAPDRDIPQQQQTQKGLDDVLGKESWTRTWLCANLSMAELREAYLKHRLVFNRRLSLREQHEKLIRGSFEHAPGVLLNTLVCWNNSTSSILNSFSIDCICTEHLSTHESIRAAVLQAWQLYNRLVYDSQKLPSTANTAGKGDTSSLPMDSLQGSSTSVSRMMYRSLSLLDNWDEATRSLKRIYFLQKKALAYDSQYTLPESDQKLVERYLALKASYSPLQAARPN